MKNEYRAVGTEY